MAITVEDFKSLTEDLQDIFNEVAKAKTSEMVGPTIFNVEDTNRRTFEHLILHGAGIPSKVTPGQELPLVDMEEGDKITWTQKYYGNAIAITKEMRMFDLYNQIEQLVRSLPEGAFSAIEQSMADILGHGWDTSYVDIYGDTVSGLGPDGVALFSASHSNNLNSSVFSNIIKDGTTSNPVLSRSAIVSARNQGRLHKDPNGLIRPVNLDTLIVPPSLSDLAERIIYSGQMAGTANNDIEPLKGKVNLVVWPQLEALSDGTDSSKQWYMVDTKLVKETLNAKFAERPSLDPPEEVYRSKNWVYTCDFFYSLGLGYPAYIFGSNGTGA